MSNLFFEEKREYIPIGDSIDTGNSVIYRALDKKLNRDVCIKKMHVDGQGKDFESNLKQAKHEIQVLAKFSNGQVPYIYDYYVENNNLYIIMQWVQGETLESLFEKNIVTEKELINWMMQLCDILDKLSQNRIYHKDIKPANLMISNNKLILIDFNISLSLINPIEGTVGYKAPEMLKEVKNVSRDKVDMFAIGVILYEYYKKSIPERGKEYSKESYRRGPNEWSKFIEPIQLKTDMNGQMNDIIVRCMKFDPNQRFRDYKELKQSFKNALGKGKDYGRKNRI